MSEQNNILFNQLKDYTVEPPNGIFENAWQKIISLNEFAFVEQEKEINKKKLASSNDLFTQQEKNTFGKLKDHSLTAPSVNMEDVLYNLQNPESDYLSDSRLTAKNKFAFAKIAAGIALIATIGLVIYNLNNKKNIQIQDGYSSSNKYLKTTDKKVDSLNTGDTSYSVIPFVADTTITEK